MKKFSFMLLGAAAMTLASCSQQEVGMPDAGTGEGNVHIAVTLPMEFNTKAQPLGNGLGATSLKVYVYELGTDDKSTLSFSADASFENNSPTTYVNLSLVPKKSYNIVFFAANPTAIEGSEGAEPVYSIDANEGTLTVNYEQMTSDLNVYTNGALMEGYDCFYNTYPTGVVGTSDINMTVTLSRPMAQVNWGTTGLSTNTTGSNFELVFGENGQYVRTNLSASNVYNTLNLLTGEVDENETTSINFENFTPPSELDADFPGNATTGQTYSYLAMQYVLAPSSTSTNYDFTLTVTNNGAESGEVTSYENDIIVSNAPVQANYQTNIYGSLLAANASFEVTKTDKWSGTNTIDMTTWDGKATTPTIDEDNNIVYINRPSDLAGLANLVNGTSDDSTPNDFEGYTVSLSADYDMGGMDFPMIGSATRSGQTADGNAFRGKFDGQGHTISNLSITAPDEATKNDAVGFIGNLDGSDAAVQNVTFENLNINGGVAEQAGVVGILTNGATVSNVTVKSGSVSATEGAGGIVGRLLASGNIEDCTNYADITVTTYNAGGIAGAAYYAESDSNEVLINISGCTNYGNVVSSTPGQNTLGGIVGTSAANINGCTNNGNVGSADALCSPVGGIAGYQNSCGYVKNCTNNGTIQGAAEVAGIVAFAGAVGYNYKEIIVIEGNTNKGAIIATGTAGGILGINRNTVNIIGNTNSAPSIKSNGNAAGIVGNGYAQGNPISGGNGYCNLSGDNTNNTSSENITGKVTNEIYTGVVYIDGELQEAIN